VSGGTGNDTIYGGSAYDELVGEAGDDKIYGAAVTMVCRAGTAMTF
jgi:Ca2+-binding RTX toxin-like protein